MSAAERLKIYIGGNHKDGVFILKSWSIIVYVRRRRRVRHRTRRRCACYAVPKLNSVPTSTPSRRPSLWATMC